MSIHYLDFNFSHDLLLDPSHLLYEIFPQLAIPHFGQVLQVSLFLSWSNQSAAISLLEKVFEKSPDSILLLHGFRAPLLLFKSVF